MKFNFDPNNIYNAFIMPFGKEEEFILVLLEAGEDRYPGFYDKQTNNLYYKRYKECKEQLELTVLANIG